MRQALSEMTFWDLRPTDNGVLPASAENVGTNADLVGQTYRCQDASVQVMSIDPARPEKYVIVQDLRTAKRWSAPAGIIRLALGAKRRSRKAA